MARKRSAEDFSEEELRHLLLEKRRTARRDYFQRTGQMTGAESGPAAAWSQEDEADELEPGPRVTQRRRKRRQALDTFLFLVEIAAILGLLVVFLNGYTVLRDLNREMAAALVQSRYPAPPGSVVLPSGHTPPGASGETQPNEAEVPEQLRQVYQSLENQPAPTGSPGQAIRIRIPAIDVDAPVVQGDSWEQLKKGVAQHAGALSPGQPGNIVLSAHNDVFGEIFRDLDRLKVGDEFTLYTNDQQFVYTITGTRIVSPTEVEVMQATEQSTATLISCYPYLIDNKRIVVKAELKNNS